MSEMTENFVIFETRCLSKVSVQFLWSGFYMLAWQPKQNKLNRKFHFFFFAKKYLELYWLSFFVILCHSNNILDKHISINKHYIVYDLVHQRIRNFQLYKNISLPLSWIVRILLQIDLLILLIKLHKTILVFGPESTGNIF